MARQRRSHRTLLTAGICALGTGLALAACSSPASPHAGQSAGQGNASGVAATSGVGQATTAGGTGSAAVRGSPATKAMTADGVGGGNNGIASTALRWPPALRGEMVRWKAGSGGAAWAAVTAQVGVPAQIAAVRQYPEARQACVSLGSSAERALGAAPIPYRPMQHMYATSLAELAQAAADCRNAISVRQDGEETVAIHLNKALLNRALAELTAGSKTLYAATADIRTLRS